MLGLEPAPREREFFTALVPPEGVSVVELAGVPAFGARHALRGWSAG
ncbi:MAG: hypothetical protein H0X71_05440 [Rubrobacter sp.]|nr:hypothetical protein [Rubrobacter sp.]